MSRAAITRIRMILVGRHAELLLEVTVELAQGKANQIGERFHRHVFPEVIAGKP